MKIRYSVIAKFFVGIYMLLVIANVAMQACTRRINDCLEAYGQYTDAACKGEHAYFAGQYDVALREFHRAAVLLPDDSEPHRELAKTYARMGRIDQAIAEYRYVIAHESSHDLSLTAWPHFELGQLLFSQHKTALARMEWQAAVIGSRADPKPFRTMLEMRRQAEQALAQTSPTK